MSELRLVKEDYVCDMRYLHHDLNIGLIISSDVVILLAFYFWIVISNVVEV